MGRDGISGSLLSAFGQHPPAPFPPRPPTHTACPGVGEARTSLAGVCDPYLGSQLGSGWVLSRAQELKRGTWRRMKDVGESSDQAVSALDLAPWKATLRLKHLMCPDSTARTTQAELLFEVTWGL